MSRLSPTAWVAVIVAAVAAFIALGTAGAVAAQNDAFTTARRTSVTAGPASPGPAAPRVTTPAPGATGANDGMLPQNGGDERPCVREDRPGNKQALPYRCPLLWDAAKTSAAMTRVPVYREFTSLWLTPQAAINQLYREAGAQYFRCHLRGADYEFPAQYGWGRAHHAWWGLTQGDEHPGRWGWVPEVYFVGGADDQPDPGLPLCTDADVALVV
ncbi:hypothetical protein ACPPVO_45960 [Dactylosporangium sp. McL0621]|uniref:hypothetical protein n=1 Tax=Dactylosporangium sp. McL0621 TaxID=3415678 RepID=UPI003CF1BDDC